MIAVEVVEPGPFASIQDLGRPGYAHLGVPRSGAADRGSLRLANRLVGNPEDAAGIETTLGGLRLRAIGDVVIAVAGAVADVARNGVDYGRNAAMSLHDGDELSIGTTTSGLRNYVAVRGGVDVEPTLGSRSTDTLAKLGPPALVAGTRLRIAALGGSWPPIDVAPVDDRLPDVVALDAADGPRADRVDDLGDLFTEIWTVNPASNRVGVRLDGAGGSVRPRTDLGELASEGIAHGSIQLPPSGQPVIFLADHPVTGGYPVVAVLTEASLDRAGQLTPGTRVRLRRRG
ncbi:biotin-dependent carboxyltransferase family protein [Gordonia sp. TBRC 11910]|uniref:Biotin-dependent carboxyltransferase family protein n=1 Tax=Gordonia asplenii TaxID=2725283 RepID=A0A848L1P8_9ACTN|nr:biotin-dependent carboxyltransferase family protein [Gordonia asplenii]NMO01578.1 biotin-dependent carboxyltransferase family protein [Gordonia asplenii]